MNFHKQICSKLVFLMIIQNFRAENDKYPPGFLDCILKTGNMQVIYNEIFYYC